MTDSGPITGCDACNKNCLSLLLVRPSPIAKDPKLAPRLSDGVADAGGLAAGLFPLASPLESRYVLRLLRAGYVHVYLPSPPPGVRQWQSFRVSDAADLIAQDNPLFAQQPGPPPCGRNGHNKAGMKLLPITQAHKIPTLWIAYSANLWSDALRAKNAGNPETMQKIDLQGCGPHEFQPTEQTLRAQLLECALPALRVTNPNPNGEQTLSDEPQFQFNSLAGEAKGLAQTMSNAAACHPKTIGWEKVVVLPDPVGVAAELNALRLRRNQWVEAELVKPENAHPLNSDAAVTGLKQVFLSSNSLNSFDKVSPLCTGAQFKSRTWPQDTEWQALDFDDRLHLQTLALGDNFLSYLFLTPYRTLLEQPDLGRAIYPDFEERAAAWARQETEKSWAELADHVDEAARTQWKHDFAARMKAQHYDALQRFEQDWLDAANAVPTLRYFATHFDPQDPNKPLDTFSAGATYAAESAAIHQPAPLSAGQQERYLQLLDEDMTSDKASRCAH